MADRCDGCFFFEIVMVYETDQDEDRAGLPDTICRRFPPLDAGWPAVLADDWCGEWRPVSVGSTSPGDTGG